jgi:hypothetical protein
MSLIDTLPIDHLYGQDEEKMTTVESIDEAIKELDEFLAQQKEKLSSDPEEGEASMLLYQSYIEGLAVMQAKAGLKLSDLRRELASEKPYQEPPKELAEFKAEVIKDMRKTIRETFNPLILGGVTAVPANDINVILMRLDKKLVNQIASIRQELPSHGQPPTV